MDAVPNEGVVESSNPMSALSVFPKPPPEESVLELAPNPPNPPNEDGVDELGVDPNPPLVEVVL